jgi:hypothetical protein
MFSTDLRFLHELTSDQVRQAAVRQHVPVTQYSKTVFSLDLGSDVNTFFSPALNCVRLHVVATEGVTELKYWDVEALLSSTTETYDGRQTVAEIDIPVHASYTFKRLGEGATSVQLTCTPDEQHEARYIYRLLTWRMAQGYTKMWSQF